MLKYAKILTQLQPHQERALKKALVNNLILAHSLGSGKTLTSIAIADALGKPSTALVPASLVTNYEKEIRKHKKGGPPIRVLSLPTAVQQDIPIPAGNTVILDEAHSARNEGTARHEYLKRRLQNAGRIIALTGTPAYNKVQDWIPLINLVSGDKTISPDEFDRKYIRTTVVDPGLLARLRGVKRGYTETLKNIDELRKQIGRYVDVYNTAAEKPQRIDETVEVPMDDEQEKVYRYVNRSVPLSIRYKVRHNLPPSKAEAAQMNAFLNTVRQVSNTPEMYQKENPEPGAKLKEAVRRLREMRDKDPHFKALVYSNYLDSGVRSYARLLDKLHIPYNLFDGSLSKNKKQRIVDDYNKGTTPIILGSGSASEGLDLKGTKLIQILEPHWNNSRIEQVIGRGIRYKSHEHLPPEERKVLVQHFQSTLRPDLFGKVTRKKNTSVDQYLTGIAADKDRLMSQMTQAQE